MYFYIFPCFLIKFIIVNQGIYLVDSINGVFLPCQFDLVVSFLLLLRVLSLFLMLAPRFSSSQVVV
jgi:hypothetical protein